ncbi:hypothetical protein [Photorhabdus viridis]|uniref:hypothetical protein n=1 Tax=Photorhabdus viridis TaxID=3163327 RepID=UPI00330758D7
MNLRVGKFEEKIAEIAIDTAVLKATVATESQLHKALNSQTWKIIAAIVVSVAMAVLSKYFLK